MPQRRTATNEIVHEQHRSEPIPVRMAKRTQRRSNAKGAAKIASGA